ncbi:phage tail tube protein [Planctopirus hydrillae]|uniref:Uncharacterized protein n=1 Tax=Planctopirus hydrillae TaxID=1841610 RepID=A0A1C3E7M7_9PLAN|nr:phage tail tube protein [Planctopirus hydrillae]ODA29258.1 hypothetical protein A6X21_09160 [Planctopirus hydrillae]
MPTPVQLITGQESFVTLVKETTWGEYPGSPTLIHVPFDSYDVEMEVESRSANPLTGFRQSMHTRFVRGMPQGSASLPLYAWRQSAGMSLAERLLTWAFGNPEAKFRESYSANHYEGLNIDNQRHLGLVVNQATLSGQENGAIMLQLDLMGYDQLGNATVGNAPAPAFDRHQLVEFDFTDSILDLNGATSIPFGGFSLVQNHNIAPNYLNSKKPLSLPTGDTGITLQLQPPKTSNTWSEKIRSMSLAGQEVEARLVLKGLHQGTGTVDTSWTMIEIDFGCLKLQQAKTARGRQIVNQPLQFKVDKPQEDGVNAIAWTFSDVA